LRRHVFPIIAEIWGGGYEHVDVMDGYRCTAFIRVRKLTHQN
jgi:hypothetical protein